MLAILYRLKTSGLTRFVTNNAGAAMVEFTIVVPLLIMITMGVIQFGYNLNLMNALTNATSAGARLLSISRGSPTVYTDTLSAVRTNNANNFDTTQLTIAISVNGTTCATDAACANLLTNAQAQPATVSTSYPCLDLLGAQTLISFAGCTLKSSFSFSVQ